MSLRLTLIGLPDVSRVQQEEIPRRFANITVTFISDQEIDTY